MPQLRGWNDAAMMAMPCTECVHGTLVIICTMSALNACCLSNVSLLRTHPSTAITPENVKFHASLLVTKTQQMVGM